MACFLFFTSIHLSANELTEIDKLVRAADSLIHIHRNYDEARSLLYCAHKRVKGENAQLLLRLSDVETRTHNFKEALAFLRELESTVDYRSKREVYYQTERQKARVYSYVGRSDKAVLIYRELIHRLPETEEHYETLALLFNAVGATLSTLESEKAEECLLRSIDFSHKGGNINFPAYNNLIDYYTRNLAFKAAGEYIDSLIYYAEKNENYLNLISAKMKQAYLFTQLGRAKEAKQLMMACRTIRSQYNISHKPSDLIFDSFVYEANAEVDTAIALTETVLQYAVQKNEIDLVEQARNQLANLYHQAGQKDNAIDMYQQLLVLRRDRDRIKQIESIATASQVKLFEQRQEKNLLSGVLAAAIPLSGIMLMLMIMWKQKKTEQNTEHHAEQIVTDQLQTKTLLLTKSQLALQQNLDFMQQLKKELRSLVKHNNRWHKPISELIHKINSSVDFQNQWEQINMHFSALHPHFLTQLKQQYPSLTDTEVRYCMFIKLNLSTEEIAGILHIEPASVTSARYRLKKKIDIAQMVNL